MVITNAEPTPRPAPHSSWPQVPSIECSCGTIHNSADGRVPVGWTVSRGEAFCVDCTRRGIPGRMLSAPRPAPAKQSGTVERVRLRGEAISLLVKGTGLMPLNSTKRVEWIKSVNKMLDLMCERAA